MSDHRPIDIWQERGGEFSYRCSCGTHWKHQQFGEWPQCSDGEDKVGAPAKSFRPYPPELWDQAKVRAALVAEAGRQLVEVEKARAEVRGHAYISSAKARYVLDAIVRDGCYLADENGSRISEPFKHDGPGVSAKVTVGAIPDRIVTADGTIFLQGFTPNAVRPGDLWLYGPEIDW